MKFAKAYQYKNEWLSLREWELKVSIPHQTIYDRLFLGWSMKEALFRPRNITNQQWKVLSTQEVKE